MNGSGGRVAQVTDVLERLLAEFGEGAEQRPMLFQAALRVCAEESRKAKQGQPTAPLDVLVERARATVLPQIQARRETPAVWSEASPALRPVPVTIPDTPPVPELQILEEDFEVLPPPVVSDAEFGAAAGEPVAGDDLQAFISLADPDPVPDAAILAPANETNETVAPVAADEAVSAESIDRAAPPEAIDRAASRDAIDRAAPPDAIEETVSPEAADDIVSLEASSGVPAEASVEADSDREAVSAGATVASRGSRSRLTLGLLGLAALAGLAYLVFQLLGARPASSDPPRSASASRASAPARPQQGPVPPDAAATGRPAVAGSELRDPSASPAVPAAPVAGAAPLTPPAASAVPPREKTTNPDAPRPPAGYAETMASPDWAGHAPTYVIPVSSYREKANAERDAVRVERRFGRPAHALRVTIPGRGDFYRVVLVGFDSAAAARSYRADSLADAPEVLPIYWLVPLD